MTTPHHAIVSEISNRAKSLINNDLKKIMREEGLPLSGNKAHLLDRIDKHAQNALLSGNKDTLSRLHYMVNNGGNPPTGLLPSPTLPHPYPSSSTPNGRVMGNGYQQHNGYSPYQQSHRAAVPTMAAPERIHFFKQSPFFEIREQILGDITLESSPSHRNTATRTLIVNDAVSNRLRDDKSMRLLLLSAQEQAVSPYSRVDIAFPSQIEVRVNGKEVKSNYKGLKGKPGSTRPADITSCVNINPANTRNTLIVTYALTQKASDQKKFNLFVFLARTKTVDELTTAITKRNVITKKSVLAEMLKKANDPDIEVGSSVMSLKDPVSTVRIQTPCRSTLCTHNQCFDGASFLQLQEQAPTWTCPICNKSISYEALAVDEYVSEILSKARNVDQVTIQPSGEWSTETNSSPKNNGYADHDDFSDDDLVEISDFRVNAIKNEHVPTPVSLNTPSVHSRETSSAPRSGQKRKSEVVDLTLSDDDEPPRPTKKVAYNTPSHHPDPSRPYRVPSFGLSHSAPHPRPSGLHHRPPSSSSVRMGAYPSQYTPTPPPPPPPPPQMGYTGYQPADPSSRQSYPGQGSSSYPTYLGSSP